jgi:hypothetical protein
MMVTSVTFFILAAAGDAARPGARSMAEVCVGYWAEDVSREVWQRSRMAPRTSLPARLTFAWCMIFAAMSVYWLLGGTVGLSTLANVIQESAAENDPDFRLTTWVTAGLKVLGGLVALASIQRWGRVIPRTLLLTFLMGAGFLLALYGVAGFVEKALMLSGVIDLPDSMGEGPARWYLAFWEPWWILGGVLFLLTANAYQKRG